MRFDNSYARELEGAFVPWTPTPASRPRECFFNHALAGELAPVLASWTAEQREAVFSGNQVPDGAQPIAQVYAGHQFGGFSPQLGDGRALLLGELIDTQGRRWDVAFKGSGRTPFSRGGDGKAALGPMLREVVIGESLHALGIPSTRALAVVATGDWVHRERALPGAVLTRVAQSHLRVGTFQYFAARQDLPRLQRLVDYAVDRHPPAEPAMDEARGDPALALLAAVRDRQATLLAQWMGVGFIHGVMNTDNMSISGQSIDFGPCAFMEVHDPKTVYSSIDHHGRYAYGRQPTIAQWNLARLAEALLPVMAGPEDARLRAAEKVVWSFESAFDHAMAQVWRSKLALPQSAADAAVSRCAQAWQDLLTNDRVDHTLGWRRLADWASGDEQALIGLFGSRGAVEATAGAAGGSGAEVTAEAAVRQWASEWRALVGEDWPQAPGVLRRANPFVVARNHQVEAALAAASDEGNFKPLESLLSALRRAFEEGDDQWAYGQPAPPEEAARHRTFCGT